MRSIIILDALYKFYFSFLKLSLGLSTLFLERVNYRDDRYTNDECCKNHWNHLESSLTGSRLYQFFYQLLWPTNRMSKFRKLCIIPHV